MKSSRLATLLLLASIANTSVAAGAYDGVYQYGLSPAYYSVHQNGNTLIVASMGFVAIGEDVSFAVGRYTVSPKSIGFWDYSMGTISGNQARVTGASLFGACTATSDVAFDAAGNATITLVAYTNAAFGTSQGVNCALVRQDIVAATGGTITLRRIF